VVCAALGRREVESRILVGTPQSLTGRIRGSVDLVVVDEAHQMPLHRGSWFARLFASLPRRPALAGLSATTFRVADGAIFGGKGWFTCQSYEMSPTALIEDGYLVPVRYVEPSTLMTVKGVKKSAGDYNQSDLVRANLGLVRDQVAVILREMETRRKGMIFAVTVAHAEEYAKELERAGETPVLIVGALGAGQRRENVAAFRSGRSRMAVTVQAALTGFDVPDLDLIASCRPTMSAIIHTQSVGRGTRPAPDKLDLLVLDFAANVPVFGTLAHPHFDRSGQPRGGIAPWRACSACATYNHFKAHECLYCGHDLPAKKSVTADDLEYGTINFWREREALLALTAKRGFEQLPVESLAVHAYRKRADPESISLMLSVGLGGEAIARMWFKWFGGPWHRVWRDLQGNMPAPRNFAEAYRRRGELVRPAWVSIEQDGNFWKVTDAGYDDEEDAVFSVQSSGRREPISPSQLERQAS
jgi:DNA repair protein RadD